MHANKSNLYSKMLTELTDFNASSRTLQSSVLLSYEALSNILAKNLFKFTRPSLLGFGVCYLVCTSFFASKIGQ